MSSDTTATIGSSKTGQRSSVRLVLSESGGRILLVSFLIVELAFFGLKVPGFLEINNILSAGRYTAVFLVVGVGTTFGLISGAIDISIAGNIALSGSSVAENLAGASFGTLSTTDQDASESFTYSITGGTDSSSFEISSNVLGFNSLGENCEEFTLFSLMI